MRTTLGISALGLGLAAAAGGEGSPVPKPDKLAGIPANAFVALHRAVYDAGRKLVYVVDTN